MELPRDAMLLRIFIGEGDELKGAPLYEKIVLRAREQKLAGATVLRGPMGFGKRVTCIRRRSFDYHSTYRW
jgi:PII-like signaling protein